MPSPRRLTPSLSLLSAFEAVCRTGSTLPAARDLDLSQDAVSRLIQNLEGQLGVTLFLREQRRLVPTDAALAHCGLQSQIVSDRLCKANYSIGWQLVGYWSAMWGCFCLSLCRTMMLN